MMHALIERRLMLVVPAGATRAGTFLQRVLMMQRRKSGAIL